MRQTVLITGCSEGGAGNALAKEYHSKGLKVFATARRLESMKNLASTPGIILLQLDVTDLSSIQKARDSVIADSKSSTATGAASTSSATTNASEGLDLLINNAGQATVMPALDQDIDATRHLFETNVFGMMMMVQTFTPLLMKSQDACIVNVGSLGGIMPWAFQTSYNATKAAIHAYSDTLRLEMRPLNIKVVTVLMGGVRTNLPNREAAPLPPNSLYAPIESDFRKAVHGEYEHRMPVDVFARQFVADTLKTNPPRTMMAGATASLVSWVNWLLPGSAMDKIISGYFGINKLVEIRQKEQKENAKTK